MGNRDLIAHLIKQSYKFLFIFFRINYNSYYEIFAIHDIKKKIFNPFAS